MLEDEASSPRAAAELLPQARCRWHLQGAQLGTGVPRGLVGLEQTLCFVCQHASRSGERQQDARQERCPCVALQQETRLYLGRGRGSNLCCGWGVLVPLHVCLAGSSGRAGAHEHRSALRRSWSLPGVPPCSPTAGCSSGVPHSLLSPPCRLQIHVPPGMPQPHPAGLPPAGPVPEPALTREHPPAALQPGTPGRGLHGGVGSLTVTACIPFRAEFLLLKGFTRGGSCQRGRPISPVDEFPVSCVHRARVRCLVGLIRRGGGCARGHPACSKRRCRPGWLERSGRGAVSSGDVTPVPLPARDDRCQRWIASQHRVPGARKGAAQARFSCVTAARGRGFYKELWVDSSVLRVSVVPGDWDPWICVRDVRWSPGLLGRLGCLLNHPEGPVLSGGSAGTGCNDSAGTVPRRLGWTILNVGSSKHCS